MGRVDHSEKGMLWGPEGEGCWGGSQAEEKSTPVEGLTLPGQWSPGHLLPISVTL